MSIRVSWTFHNKHSTLTFAGNHPFNDVTLSFTVVNRNVKVIIRQGVVSLVVG